nr:DUF3905 domain-containing protein [Paenibacillus paeoniae]
MEQWSTEADPAVIADDQWLHPLRTSDFSLRRTGLVRAGH